MRWYTAVAAKQSPDGIDHWTQNSLGEDRITIRSAPSNPGSSFPLPPMTAPEAGLHQLTDGSAMATKVCIGP
jgi:hypothetical protein